VDPETARRRLDEATVGRLATVTRQGRPHVVPCCFALQGETIYSGVDAKPKSTLALRRLDNLWVNPAATLLVDHYEDDWSALWWVRVDGRGRIVADAAERRQARMLLKGKYPQYREVAIPGEVIALDVERITSWP
jgi:PPOX class probable F420-dependent enzyme